MSDRNDDKMDQAAMEARLRDLLREREESLFSEPSASPPTQAIKCESVAPRPSSAHQQQADAAAASTPSPRLSTTDDGGSRGGVQYHPPTESPVTVDEREESTLLSMFCTMRVVPYAHADTLGDKFLYAATERGFKSVAIRLFQCIVAKTDHDLRRAKKHAAMIRKAAINAFLAAHLDIALFLSLKGGCGVELRKGHEEEDAYTLLKSDADITETSFFRQDDDEELLFRARAFAHLMRLVGLVCSLDAGDQKGRRDADEASEGDMLMKTAMSLRGIGPLSAAEFVRQSVVPRLIDTTQRERRLCGKCGKNVVPRDPGWQSFAVFGISGIEDGRDANDDEEDEEGSRWCTQCYRARDFQRRLRHVPAKTCGECGESYLAFAHRIRLYKDGCNDWAKCPSCGNVERSGGEAAAVAILTKKERMQLSLAGALFGSR